MRYDLDNQTHESPLEEESTNVHVSWLPVAAICVVVVAIAFFFGDGAAAESSAVDERGIPHAIEVHVVQPGQTLWEIAAEIRSPDQDIREVVNYLQNAAGGSSLDVGQHIVIDHAAIG